MKKDDIYSKPLAKIGDFVFDKQVADCFEDMINRSVPGYRSIVAMVGVLAEKYAKAGTNVYDLGSSLGASTLVMKEKIAEPDVKIVAIDSSEAMITKARSKVSGGHIEWRCEDLRDTRIENASVVVMNFTLQFIESAQRREVLQKIYDGLIPGGVLILSEKISFADASQNELQTNLYHEFKRLNGYSNLEISQKRTALENVLIADTLETHYQRLEAVGFANASLWFQCFNFVSMVAFRKK